MTESLDLAAIEVMDLLPVLIAFVLGFGARLIGLPPLVGFRVAGFLLKACGMQGSDALQEIADLGVTLLLFTIGLKLKVRQLLSPAVWATATVHMGIVVLAGSFIDTILYTAPVVWIFFLATGVSVFVLRRTDRETQRPFKVAGLPLTAGLFCACSVFMLYSCVTYAYAVKPKGLVLSCVVLLAGAVVYAATASGRAESGGQKS